ncbi:MAG: hypothetical protein RL701_6575 [Pseudomonadota bacterium]|jgi:ABC-type uncharacterized transport system involved in gliding motility auxiliary subunit
MADAGIPTKTNAGQRASAKRTASRIQASTSTLLLLLIVALGNYLAFRHYKRFDMTSQSIFTLSPKSVSLVSALDKDVDFYVFLARNEPSFLSTDELLKRYAAASQHAHLHYVDPDREQTQFKLLAQRFGISAGVLESGEAQADVAVVVALGEQNRLIGREDLTASDIGGMDRQKNVEEIQFKGEQVITEAVVAVTSGRKTKVCSTQGHGEWGLEEGGERSLSGLKRGLHHDNLELDGFETLGKTAVPSDCDAVLVVGPLHAFSDAEVKLLIDYVRAGGNLFLALDPVLERDQIASTGFEGPLRDIGIRLDRDVVFELDKGHVFEGGRGAEFVVTEFGGHVATKALQHSARVAVALARSVTPISETGDVEILMRASEQSFGKTTMGDLIPDQEPTRGAADIAGPVSIAVATQLKALGAKEVSRGGRLVVIGDSDLFYEKLLEAAPLANFHLASALIGWVAQQPSLIEIPPKKIKSGNIVLTQEDMSSVFFRVVVLIPAAALILGLAVWLNRRS